MYICYLDESGVQENAGTSHFVLIGMAIIGEEWRSLENQITSCKQKYDLAESEIHTAWLMRRYLEQEKVRDFAMLPWKDRRLAADQNRKAELIRIAAHKTAKALKEAKLNQRKTEPYIHLTYDERKQLLRELADIIGGWQECRLFCQAVDKRHNYSGPPKSMSPFEYAFTQLVQRFEDFLKYRGRHLGQPLHGLLVQDNNETVSRRLTEMMRKFHREGTRSINITHIVETPLFVDSHLTSMVQMADLCGYATRRYFENGEIDLFDRIWPRFDRAGAALVGIRHATAPGCQCRICGSTH